MSTNIFPGQFRLSRIQAMNWGTFGGTIDVEVPREGFLITGGSGTGKSTLLDAMSAVLLPGDKLRFNAAAQANTPRGKGRNLVTYIRGAWGSREDHATGTVVNKTARPKATNTSIVLTYSDGQGTHYSLVALFYLKAHANSVSDVDRLYGVIDGNIDATAFTPFLTSGIDTRKIKQAFPQGTFNAKHAAFASTFRRRLNIPGVEAMELLHRTQSAKDLQSLDDLFRGYVLHQPITFDLADQAVAGFSDLEGAYRKVMDVAEQIKTLEPLVGLREDREKAIRAKEQSQSYLEALPKVARQLQREEALEHISSLTVELEQATNARAQAEQRRISLNSTVVSLEAALNEKVSSRLAIIDNELNHANQRLTDRRQRLDKLSRDVLALNGQPPSSLDDFEQLQADARQILADFDAELEKNNRETHANSADLAKLKSELDEVSEELASLAKRTSNIGQRHIAMRERACIALGLHSNDLPFAGELIDVEDKAWEPVIQRQLRGLATVMLVPSTVFNEVRRWVADNNLGIYLRLNSVHTDEEFTSRLTSQRSLVRKVRVVDSPMRPWLNRELAQRYDFECVDSAEELDELNPRANGMTKGGLVRLANRKNDSTTRWEKDDRHALGDKRHWFLGSTNHDKIELLQATKTKLDRQVEAKQRTIEKLNHTNRLLHAEAAWATTMQQMTFQDVDVAAAQEAIASLQAEREALRASSEAADLFAKLEAAQASLTAANAAYDEAGERLGAAKTRLQDQHTRLQELDEEDAAYPIDATKETSDKVRALLKEKNRRIRLAIDDVRRDCSNAAKRAADNVDQDEKKIIVILTDYLGKWKNESADLRADIAYLPDALDRLALLKGERLGEFSSQFRDLINRMSTQSLGQLGRIIRTAKDDIERRIAPVNASLAQSEFNHGRYLRIDVRDARGEEVKKFLRDIDAVASGGLSTADDATAMKRYEAISAIVSRLSSSEHTELRWRHTVLDTRRHVKFIGIESASDGTVVNTYADSTSLSGGQAQKLVFFCLAAALRYQLAPDGTPLPGYATVVLDEAFDRADPTFTRQTMDVFSQFGFHMILATPLKLIQVLGSYVGGSIVFDYKEEEDTHGNVRGISRYSTIKVTADAPA